MEAEGMAVDEDGMPPRVHVDRLWRDFHTLASGRREAPYAMALDSENPFEYWSTDKRYANRNYVDIATVCNHRAGAVTVRKLVDEWAEDGVSNA